VSDRFEAADARLLSSLDEAWEGAARVAGERLACAPGCTDCCMGPFPITPLDVRRLRRGLDALRLDRPERAEAVLLRAKAAVARMSGRFPGDPSTGRLSEDDSGVDRFLERHRDLPCPALDPGEGLCELYSFRPVTCRTFGPPVRLGDEDLPPCRLCFGGSPPDEIEGCRVVPDREGIEDRILDEIEAADGDSGDTLVAWALLRS